MDVLGQEGPLPCGEEISHQFWRFAAGTMSRIWAWTFSGRLICENYLNASAHFPQSQYLQDVGSESVALPNN